MSAGALAQRPEPQDRDDSVQRTDRDVTPILPKWERRLLAALVSSLDTAAPANELRRVARRWRDFPAMERFCATILVLADLADQGWRLLARGDNVILKPLSHLPSPGESAADVKRRLQKVLRQGRDRQLEQPSVQAFLRKVERPRANGASIADLVCDGAALAEKLADVSRKDGEAAIRAYKKIIDPEVEVCESGARCADTGLALMNIWRYFRHTWSLEYRSTPGRSMPILLRNRAAPNRPVIGIAMLVSPVMKLRARDEWLGWSMAQFTALAENIPTERARLFDQLRHSIDSAIDAIRFDDLMTVKECASPTQNVVFRLARRAAGAIARREETLRDFRDAGVGAALRGDVTSKRLDDIDWQAASEDPLFVKKRAETLAVLIDARARLAELADPNELAMALRAAPFRRAAAIAIREMLKEAVSTELMDVAVCGAVPPFNDLLFGKLVALAMASQEVQDAYRERYDGRPSIIASQMAGRPIAKPAQLRVLTTSSLYGLASSQYNRLRLDSAQFRSLSVDIYWEQIARTIGFGSIHLGAEAVAALRRVSAERYGMRRINMRFGEGTNPRMRQIREGLEVLGIQSDEVLQHSTSRILYGCRLGEADPILPYAFSKGQPAQSPLAVIYDAWVRRWGAARLAREGVLDRVRSEGPTTVKDDLWRNANGQFRLDLGGC